MSSPSPRWQSSRATQPRSRKLPAQRSSYRSSSSRLSRSRSQPAFIGAGYSSGSIINWLTFVPRRSHVFWSKLLAVAWFAAILGTLVATLVVGATLMLAQLHGSPVEAVPELAGIAVRGILPVVVLAVLGFCVGLLTRHTAGALGILLAALVACFVRIGALGQQTWAQRITPLTPEGNIAALIDRGYTYAVPVEKVTRDRVAR